MGIFQSAIRWLGCGSKNGEGRNDEESNYFYRFPHHNDSSSSSDNISRFRKIRAIAILFSNGLKALFQKFSFLLFFKKSRKREEQNDPILPVANPPQYSILLHDDDPPFSTQTRPGLVFSSSSVKYSGLDNHRDEDHEDKDLFVISLPSSSSSSISGRDIIYEEEKEEGRVGEVASPAISMNWKKMKRNRSRKEKKKKKSVNGMGVVHVDQCRWIKHYSSKQRILIVGEGDFSFSASLAVAFGSASNITATSLDSHEFLKENYGTALFNIQGLKSRGCTVMHEIDATKLAENSMLGHLKFDRIIFNFPYAGWFKDLSRELQLRRHRSLVSRFLMNAKKMLKKDGEIHISHKTNEFHAEWKLVGIASSHWLSLIEAVQFNQADYPGYNTKFGFGGDNNFDCNPSQTYKFGLRSSG